MITSIIQYTWLYRIIIVSSNGVSFFGVDLQCLLLIEPSRTLWMELESKKENCFQENKFENIVCKLMGIKRRQLTHWGWRCDMAFIEPMHRNKPNITYLLIEAAWRIYASVNYPSLVQIMACRLAAPSDYQNQCWNNVNRTLGSKYQWNFNRNSYIFIKEKAFENIIRKMMVILHWPQYVKCRLRDKYKLSDNTYMYRVGLM